MSKETDAISAELYAVADKEETPHKTGVLMRNAALVIDVYGIRLARAIVALRTVRQCVEVYRDKYDYSLGVSMLRDLDEAVEHLSRDN